MDDQKIQKPSLPPVKDSGIVKWGYQYHNVVILVVCVLIAFGIYALEKMNKNEFPDFTIREGVLVAVYPGATSAEMEQRVMKKMEDYTFSFKEVKKSKTTSRATNGMVMTFVNLDDNVKDTDEFWSKFYMGIPGLKRELPSGVLGVELISNFGETSAILLTMQSKDKTYRELGDYTDLLKDRLRTLPIVGTMTVYGKQEEQISIYIDPKRLSHYAIDEKTLAASLFTQGFKTTGGDVRLDGYTSPIIVQKNDNSVEEIANMIVFSTPSGDVVRLRDVADVKREYPSPDSYITNNDEKCILLSIEMKKGHNVVELGTQVDAELEAFQQSLPEDVTVFKITDQPKVVNSSVWDFLKELLIAVIAVVIAIMLLLPFRVALIAASTIPITIFVSLGFFYAFGIELNTVTLAVLILSLGMIVDNSVVIIDEYVDLLASGMNPMQATLRSGSEFFKSIFSATLAISVTFFPFLLTMKGMFRDFLTDFPWAITIILMISLFIAELLVPFMQYRIIKPAKAAAMYEQSGGKKHFSVLSLLQGGYDRLITICFNWPKTVLVLGVFSIATGCYILAKRPMEMMPIAERDQFAVEIFMPTGTSVERTSELADSLAAILRKDPRVVSVANFHGCSSPRFQTTYAPQVGGPNFAQFIVNTTGHEATIELLNEYTPRYRAYFPDGNVRFKQLSYSNAAYPVEVRVSGEDLGQLQSVSDSIMFIMRSMPELNLIRTSLGTPLAEAYIIPDRDKMARLGLSTMQVETNLAMRYGKGLPLATFWDGTYSSDVVLKTTTADSASYSILADELIPVSAGLGNVPLNQFADVSPRLDYGELMHRNGIRTISIPAEVERGENVMAVTDKLRARLDKFEVPDGVTLVYGGEYEDTMEILPDLLKALMLAVAIIFFILLAHYKKAGVSVLLLVSLALCIPGAGLGLAIQGVVLSLTCVLGFISLMGILVRNAIIMIDYAEELQRYDGMSVRDAIFASARRRMRPIFLTSAAASMGVIPMMIGKSPLWMPMGTVIFWGTLITMVFILTVIPVAYWKTQEIKIKNQ